MHDRDTAQPGSVESDSPVPTPDDAGNNPGTQAAQNAPAPYSAQEEPPQQDDQDAHMAVSERNATRRQQKTLGSAEAADTPASDSHEPVESEQEPEEHPVRRLEWPAGSGVKLEPVPSGRVVSGLHACICTN